MKLNISEDLLVRSISCGLTLTMLGTSVLASSNTLPSVVSLEESVDSQISQIAQSSEPELQRLEIIDTIDITSCNVDDKSNQKESLKTYLMYVDGYSVYYRSRPIIDDRTTLGTLSKGDEVDVIDQKGEWCQCVIDDKVVYIHADLLVDECTVQDVIEVNRKDEYRVSALIYDSEVPLNSDLGRVDGPSGEETYYNLNMKKCVQRMHDLGYEGDYWIREDGVKMFGEYVMVAANFEIRPLGTILETSLGSGICVDTGSFVEDNPYGIDVATTW